MDTNKGKQVSIFENNILRGIEKDIISVLDDNAKITYHCSREYTTSFKNPEEKVRASYFTELVLDYNYSQEKIDIEVPVPRRIPKDRADIVVYEDEEFKKPYLIVECKRDGITDAEFKQATEQVFGYCQQFCVNFFSAICLKKCRLSFTFPTGAVLHANSIFNDINANSL